MYIFAVFAWRQSYSMGNGYFELQTRVHTAHAIYCTFGGVLIAHCSCELYCEHDHINIDSLYLTFVSYYIAAHLYIQILNVGERLSHLQMTIKS